MFVPFLALIPAAVFATLGVRALGRGGLHRDGGIVLLLVAAAWALLAAFQAATLAWQRTVAGAPIRIDLVLTVPIMAVVSLLGTGIQAGLARRPPG